jgi:hypothetical protein
MYIFFVFFLVVVITRSAGIFKLGLHGNIERDICIYNLTKPCISKAHWLYNQNTHTEREKIKRELSDIYTHNHTQDTPKTIQNHEKNSQKLKTNKKKDIYMSNCHLTNHFKMIKNENKVKKEEQKYNSVYNALLDKMGHFPSNN